MVLTIVRPFCYKLFIFWISLNHLDPFHVHLNPFHVYLDPFHVYKSASILIGKTALNITHA